MKSARARVHLCVALVSLSLAYGTGPAQPAGGQEPKAKPPAPREAGALKVENEAGKEVTLSSETVAKLPRQSVKVKDRGGNAVTDEGVTLAEVLRSGGVKLGKELRGPLLANCLVVEAGDGYRVVFALPEVDPDMTDKLVLLADRKDGKPLAADEGPYRVIVPDDKRNMRWVRQVTRVSVRGSTGAAEKEKPAAEKKGAADR